MTTYYKDTVVVDVVTFDELIEIGKASGVPVYDGMPWSFKYQGYPVTHENNDCYLVSTEVGTLRFNRGDMLITDEKGAVYPCHIEKFRASFKKAELKTVVIQVGNSDDKLSQKEWHKFVSMTCALVSEKAEEIHFFESSFGWAEWQNACWVFTIKAEFIPLFKETLKELRQMFKQDSIAWLEGQTLFI